ncbi:MAG: hypothetical protein AAF135_03375 [Bacteroidota bacterium]
MQGELDRRLEEAKANQEEDEPQVYEINPQVQVQEELFQQSLKKYAEKLKSENRMNLSSVLMNGKSRFEHNKWYFVVENELQLNLVDKEKALLPYLRKELGIRDLFGELAYDASQAEKLASIPYTDEEKLKAMAEKNPSLYEFQKIFNTRIIY